MDKKKMFTLGDRKVSVNTFDFMVRDYITKDVLFTVDYATDVSINSEYDELELRGGATNRMLAKIFHTPVANFNSNLPLIDNNVIEVKTGSGAKEGKIVNNYYKVFEVNRESGKVEIPFKPEPGTLRIYNTNDIGDLGEEIKVGAPSSKEDEYSIEEKTITFNDAKKAQKVLVVFDYITGEKSQEISMLANSLPKYVTITAKALVQDQEGRVAVQTLIIPRAQPDPNFTLDSAAGDASSIPFNCEIFADNNADGELEFYRFVVDEDMGDTIGAKPQPEIQE